MATGADVECGEHGAVGTAPQQPAEGPSQPREELLVQGQEAAMNLDTVDTECPPGLARIQAANVAHPLIPPEHAQEVRLSQLGRGQCRLKGAVLRDTSLQEVKLLP